MNPVSAAGLNAFFTMNNVWLGAKILYLVAFLVYVGFAVVVVIQTKQMANTISGGFEKQINLLAWAHLALAILAFIWALMIL